ncbi:hypothetical protein W823_23280 [Williamsia sp. D3]|nr:hypothetical protein W823_23280 [Williamsia sp. D3]
MNTDTVDRQHTRSADPGTLQAMIRPMTRAAALATVVMLTSLSLGAAR